MTTNFKIAAIALLLICAVAAQAQFPKPALPPTPAPIGTIQPQQTAPFGFDTLGFIQYAAVDPLKHCGLWNTGSPAGACPRAALRADPGAGDDNR